MAENLLEDLRSNLNQARDHCPQQWTCFHLPRIPSCGGIVLSPFQVCRSQELAHFLLLLHESQPQPVRDTVMSSRKDMWCKPHQSQSSGLAFFPNSRAIKRDFYLLSWIQSYKTVVSMELFIDNPFPTTKRESSENKTKQSLSWEMERERDNLNDIIWTPGNNHAWLPSCLSR